MKRRVKQNQWDNWMGYEGTKMVHDFGTDVVAAGYWLRTGIVDFNACWEEHTINKAAAMGGHIIPATYQAGAH